MASIAILAIIIIVVGYAALGFLGILGSGSSDTGASPTPTLAPAGGPTDNPDYYATPTIQLPTKAPPTATPAPVSPYKFSVNIDTDVSSRSYTVSYTLNQGSPKLDMGSVKFSVWDGNTNYEQVTYDQAMQAGSHWANSNGDAYLDPGETFVFTFNGYSLSIPPDSGPKVSIILGSDTIKTVTMPPLQNPSSTPAYPPSDYYGSPTPIYPPY